MIQKDLAAICEHCAWLAEKEELTATRLTGEGVKLHRQDMKSERECLKGVDPKRPPASTTRHAQDLVGTDPVLLHPPASAPWITETHADPVMGLIEASELEGPLGNDSGDAVALGPSLGHASLLFPEALSNY